MPVPHHMTFHGGGGTILSVGLLRALNFTAWQECVEGMKWRQGDRYARGRCPCVAVCTAFTYSSRAVDG